MDREFYEKWLQALHDFPDAPGIYLMKGEKGEILYVGKSKSIKKRLRQYFTEGGDGRPMIPYLLESLHEIDFIVVKTEKEALIVENTLIKKWQPKYNALLKDDKSFFSLYINSKAPWPRLDLIRSKKEKPKIGRLFGPYPHAKAARETFDLLQRLFPLRQCSDAEFKRRSRPCLLYDMKRCLAPCVGKCTNEEYFDRVKGVIQFLEGNTKEVVAFLEVEIEKASEKMEFERAKALYETLQNLSTLDARAQAENWGKSLDFDAIALYRKADQVSVARAEIREQRLQGVYTSIFEGVLESDEELITSYLLQYYKDRITTAKELLVPFSLSSIEDVQEILNIAISIPKQGGKKEAISLAALNAQSYFEKARREEEICEKALLELQESLHLSRYPEWIHCIDQSHISGASAVSAVVAFENGKKAKSQFRKYSIKTASTMDDYGMLRETLFRHLMRCQETGILPDLLVIDGGKGHLSQAKQVVFEMNMISLDLIAIAKEEGRHDKGLSSEKIYFSVDAPPVVLSSHSPLLFLLQRIRDEAHRFAMAYHKVKRKKALFHSELDEIIGIGPVKKKRLLAHFGSVKKLFSASEEELMQCKGIGKKDAERIYLCKKKKSE